MEGRGEYPRQPPPGWRTDQQDGPSRFSRGVFVWGEPIWVDHAEGEGEMEHKALLLERRLQEITERTDHYFEKGR